MAVGGGKALPLRRFFFSFKNKKYFTLDNFDIYGYITYSGYFMTNKKILLPLSSGGGGGKALLALTLWK